jgi:type II secretory pathway pseudopilin PulG
MPLTNAAAGFIGASVTLVLVIIFMILMVILVRQCLAFISKRNTIRAQVENQRQIREQIRARRGSVTEPIPATFDWHHSIRIAGTPPPSYGEAKSLPKFKDSEPAEAEAGGEAGANGVTVVQNNGAVHLQEQRSMDVVVQVEEEGDGATNSQMQAQDRTFTTGYTEFSSAT